MQVDDPRMLRMNRHEARELVMVMISQAGGVLFVCDSGRILFGSDEVFFGIRGAHRVCSGGTYASNMSEYGCSLSS